MTFVGLLARYYNPRVSVTTRDLNDNPPIVLIPNYHPGLVAGQRPMDARAQARVLQAIGSIGEHDADADIRKLAKLIVSQISIYPQ
jgi:hypothetical protein